MLRNKNVTSKSCVVSKMIRINFDTTAKSVAGMIHSKIQSVFQLNFCTKKEPHKLNGNLLNSIVRAVVSVTNVNYRSFYGLYEA